MHFHFIREIPMFARYEVRASVGAWDDKWIWVVSRFVGPAFKKSKSRSNKSGTPSQVPTPAVEPGAGAAEVMASDPTAQALLARGGADGAGRGGVVLCALLFFPFSHVLVFFGCSSSEMETADAWNEADDAHGGLSQDSFPGFIIVPLSRCISLWRVKRGDLGWSPHDVECEVALEMRFLAMKWAGDDADGPVREPKLVRRVFLTHAPELARRERKCDAALLRMSAVQLMCRRESACLNGRAKCIGALAGSRPNSLTRYAAGDEPQSSLLPPRTIASPRPSLPRPACVCSFSSVTPARFCVVPHRALLSCAHCFPLVRTRVYAPAFSPESLLVLPLFVSCSFSLLPLLVLYHFSATPLTHQLESNSRNRRPALQEARPADRPPRSRPRCERVLCAA
ncbi:hypothetical protein FB451DRAFT_370737 [Mycena latifolia]|nr:hypothetical protein FB451DRAFT_272898 [Mycena latifolia]KAJ7469254.1 hypothetical protein FB451DRAFT_370737 [Mycena latifolia]